MSDLAAPPAATVTPPAPTPVDQQIGELKKSVSDLAKLIEQKSAPVYPPGFNPQRLYGGKAPYGTTGPLSDKPYSFLKLVAAKRGLIHADQAKYELHVGEELRKSYNRTEVGQHYGVNGVLCPFGIDLLTCENDSEQRLQTELREKFMADRATFIDPGELGYVKKALGSNVDTAGGPLVGFPALGELVDMQRNLEAFSNAGASQVPLGPNGQMYYPKLISGATASFIGENPPSGLTTSQPTTGSLLLQAKTLAIRVPLSNQLLKFNLISAEAMVRTDMARIAALAADGAMFDGTGGNKIKGLLTYDTQSTWAQGVDKLISFAATTTGAAGDTLNSIDLYKMIGALPDAVGDSLSWIIRKGYWWQNIATARAGGDVAGDGPYLHSFMRTIEDGITSGRFLGNKLILTSQSPNTRAKGAGTNLVCVILGFFPDWLIGRAGVVEMDVNPYGDTPWQNLQTELRLVEYIDAGPRHAASFAVVDKLLPTAFTA